ncbi:hypothetical protein Drose_02975 [Dactylosporangium roseum]|uniref:PE domain-containing protein n=1 Tax=Dactylosporangium roseum TaxID=47989 RepID=A0ABY5Z5E4_9ACTN|nr:hypothetical protein [Dactylosporangium roseum]UWZ37270.1 hypothetical protein Drose_02975 [Dactylosporangium roseum]
MAREIRADPDALIELAAVSLEAADRVGEAYRDDFRHLPVAEAAFGDLPTAADACRTADGLLAFAHDAIAGLAAVLEGDADRLLRTAFAYRAADRAADVRVGGSRGAGL